MASFPSLHSARSSILRLPPQLRAAAYQHTPTRSFSASQPRRSILVDLTVSIPTGILDGLHGLGLPWYAALPTAAVLVRGVLVYYACTLPAQRDAQVRSHLIPLAAASSRFGSEEYREWPAKWSIPTIQKLDFMYRKWWVRRQALEKLGKQFEVPTRWERPVVNFVSLIAFMEAVRMKCSSREGLLPLLLSPFEMIGKGLSSELPPPAPASASKPKMSRDEVLAARLEQTAATDESGNIAYDLSPVGPTPSAAVEPTAYFDPSMQTEGLSWCIDLTAPDSTFILPVVLWLSISANIIFRRTAGGSKTAASPKTEDATPRKAELKFDDFTTGPMDPKALKVLTAPTYGDNTSGERFLGFLPPINNAQRIGLCIAMALGGAMLQMPAAVLLYFIPSLAVGWVQRRWLDAKYPIRPPIQPCRRPLRSRVKKQWRE